MNKVGVIMEVYYDGELINFSERDLDYMYLDEGTEGIVYRYKKDALKIYNEFSSKCRLDEDTARELTLIGTNRILLPRKLLHNISSKFVGYSTMLLERYSPKYIANMKMSYFNEECSLLCQDCDTLGDRHVDIEDLNSDNMIYDGNIYVCDPGSYKIRSNDSIFQVKKHNREVMKKFLVESILKQSSKLSRREQNNLNNHFLLDDYPIEDILCEEADPNETVKTYVKRIVK